MLPANNLQCKHPEHVYMLLKSTEFVGRHLEQIAQPTPSTNRPALDASEPTSASLGITTAPSQQEEYTFRPQLVLVTFYHHLQSPLLQSHICTPISQNHACKLSDYVKDVYLTKDLKDKQQDKHVQSSENLLQLRLLVHRRIQSPAGTTATYSSNMVPKDLVQFANTNQANSSSVGGESMSVDQILKPCNQKVVSEQAPQTEPGK